MDILFSVALALLIILLITQFLDSKHFKILRILGLIGIFIGIAGIIYVSVFASTVKITSPTEITTQNSTNENLKIYAITFDQDVLDTINRIVYFDRELSNAKTSTFSIDNKKISKFWIVGKNDANEIKYLKEIDDINSKVNLEINQGQNFGNDDAQTARELIFDRDIKKQLLNFVIWSNIIIILLLVWSIYKLSQKRKNV